MAATAVPSVRKNRRYRGILLPIIYFCSALLACRPFSYCCQAICLCQCSTGLGRQSLFPERFNKSADQGKDAPIVVEIAQYGRKGCLVVLALFDKFQWFGRSRGLHDALHDSAFGDGDCFGGYCAGDACGFGDLDLAFGSDIALDMAGHDDVARLDGALP